MFKMFKRAFWDTHMVIIRCDGPRLLVEVWHDHSTINTSGEGGTLSIQYNNIQSIICFFEQIEGCPMLNFF